MTATVDRPVQHRPQPGPDPARPQTARPQTARPQTARPNAARIAAQRGVPVLEVVVPVHNEQAALAGSVRRLHGYLREQLGFSYRITIADNASVDATPAIARELAAEIPEVEVARLEQKGRGRALHQVWANSDAPVLAYMDVDLSTDLAGLLPLVAPLISGHSDIAIGTRLARSARVVRGPKREFISRCYNLILRSALSANFTDAQCGFKAIRAEVAQALLPLVRDNEWFFDTELLVLAQRCGMRIHEVPVDWIDDPDSRVDLMSTAIADLRGIARLLKGFATGDIPITEIAAQFGPADEAGLRGRHGPLLRQGVFFATVGVASTVAYLLLFLALRSGLGPQGANLVALLITAVGNTAANRRLTFGVRGRRRIARHHLQGLAVFAVGLGLTSGALALLHAVSDPSRPVELGVLIAANLAATMVRFALLRGWVFRAAGRQHSPSGKARA